jgi:hypothetical protein
MIESIDRRRHAAMKTMTRFAALSLALGAFALPARALEVLAFNATIARAAEAVAPSEARTIAKEEYERAHSICSVCSFRLSCVGVDRCVGPTDR